MSINLDKTSTALDTEIATPYTIPRVNLMPAEVLERRAVRRVQTGLGAAALASLVMVGGAYLWAQHDADKAAEGLAAEQAVTTSLSAEQEKYADVPKTIALVEQAVQARDTAMAQDINWSTVVGQVAATYPADLWMDTLQATLTSPPGTTPTTTTGVDTSAVATIQTSGSALTHPTVAAWLDSVKRVSHVTSPKLQSSVVTAKSGRTVVQFDTTMKLSEGAFSNPVKDGN